MSQLEKIKEKWTLASISRSTLPTVEYLDKFKRENNVYLPHDVEGYFKQLNGTDGEYTDDLYEFYPIHRIKRVKDEFRDWKGVPNYFNLLKCEEIRDLFVFGNFSFYLFAYAIRLDPMKVSKNEVYILCGEDHKKIANTFSEFLDLYLDDSIELQFN